MNHGDAFACVAQTVESVEACDSVSGCSSPEELEKKPKPGGTGTKRAALALLSAAGGFGALHLYWGRGAGVTDLDSSSAKITGAVDDAMMIDLVATSSFLQTGTRNRLNNGVHRTAPVAAPHAAG